MKPNMPLTINSRGHISRLYRVRFSLLDGSVHTWDHYGSGGTEHALIRAKYMITREYGEAWGGGVAICGQQGDSGEYAF